MESAIINNRVELLDWIKENIKALDDKNTVTLSSLEDTSSHVNRIHIRSYTDRGLVNSTVSWPSMMEKYPIILKIVSGYVYVENKNGWLLDTLLREISKGAIGVRHN